MDGDDAHEYLANLGWIKVNNRWVNKEKQAMVERMKTVSTNIPANELLVNIRMAYVELDKLLLDKMSQNKDNPDFMRSISIARTELETSSMHAMRAWCLADEVAEDVVVKGG